MSETQSTTLAIFARPSWFTDPSSSRIWLRLHTVIWVPVSNAASILKDIPKTLELDGPIGIGIAVLGGLKPHRFRLLVHANDAGEVVVNTHVDEVELPKASYVSLATPLRVDGIDVGEHIARRRLSVTAGLLAATMGVHFLRDTAFDGDIDLSTGQPSFTSPVIRVPQPTDGPFLHSDLLTRLSAIQERLRHRKDTLGARLRLALHQVDRARDRQEGFFCYWSALELVVGGRTGAIRSALARAYGLSRHTDVDDLLGFRTLARWRHDYVHNGLEPSLHSPVERYLQMMILELISYSLDLPVMGLLPAVRQSPGWDLQELGIPLAPPPGA